MRYDIGPGAGMHKTIREALDAAKRAADGQAELVLAPGLHREKVVLDLPGATLRGDSAAKSILVWNDCARPLNEAGVYCGTFQTATMRVTAPDVTLRSLTIRNDAGQGVKADQAVALYLAGDRCTVLDCILEGYQDTLFIGPDWPPMNEPAPCGRRAWLEKCIIRGNVDFIFGSYAAWFEGCELNCRSRGEAVNAMIAAPNTPAGQEYGFVFHACRITGDCASGTVYLGRPWRPFGQAAFLHCEMDAQVAPVGWLDWEKPFRPVHPGLCETSDTFTPTRHPGSLCLSPGEEERFTPARVLAGDGDFRPFDKQKEDPFMRVEAFIKDYLARYTPYKSYWNYEDGCVLMGCIQLYQATGDSAYRDFVLSYLDERVAADGSIPCYETAQYNIDSINSGKALFFALDETGEEKYRTAIEYHMQRLREHPRCTCGNFWHKSIYPEQIWLDGLYMAQPFYMEYEKRFGGMKQLSDIVDQYANVKKYCWDENKQLYYHACDTVRQQPWANAETGCSANFWLRSMGWLLMSMADCLGLMDERLFDPYKRMEGQFREAVRGLTHYRDEATGLFLQVIDHPEAQGNYAETSGSAMAAYALMKGARLGALNAEKYLPVGRDVFEKLAAQKLVQGEDGQLHLKDICKVAGLGPGAKRDGSVAYYLSEPRCEDDSKGVGPFMMAYAQYLMTTEG